MISIVACCHGAKLCAHAARDFRSQQQQWVGSINEVMNVKSSMDGDKMEPVLPNK